MNLNPSFRTIYQPFLSLNYSLFFFAYPRCTGVYGLQQSIDAFLPTIAAEIEMTSRARPESGIPERQLQPAVSHIHFAGVQKCWVDPH